MKQKNIIFLINAFWLMPLGLSASSLQQLSSEISNTHVELKKIDDKYNKGDISLKKSEEKKYPLWKQLATYYNSLSSFYYYNSKSSIGLSIPANFTAITISIPNMSDVYFSANDIAMIKNSFKSGGNFDVRIYFNAASKIIFYSVVNIASNLTVTSGVISTKLTSAPASWYLLVEINGKWQGTESQALNNSIYLQVA